MNTAAGTIGNTVVHMPTFEPQTIKALFTNLDVSSAKEINARFVASQLGELSLIRSIHSSRHCSSRRLQRHMSERDSHYFFACLPLEGGLEIRHFGRSCSLRRGSLGFVATKEEYVIQMSDYLDALWLRMPAPMLRSHVISMDELLGCSLDISTGIGFAAMALMHASITEGNELSSRGAHLIAQSLLGFIGELANSALRNEAAPSTLHRRKILARARDYIEEHLSDETLSPQDIARGIGVSLRYLSELFAAEGSSAMRWVQKRRLERCRMELERHGIGHQPIREVAYSMGFANVSSFNRAFKSYYGRSPRSLMQTRNGAASDDERAEDSAKPSSKLER
jgi:AraC-like DNA-binding protein